ncbi:hypothetical protein CDAR_183951 [Caerostris darwini]|uniref:Uncharacterized protein n=1 Tax=Caerostris darwini TaxID=1538125 RepID=A0AAV4TY30_9ARAC|nr:hypothetical protein CDAR_183951 [Caerostris darwini]
MDLFRHFMTKTDLHHRRLLHCVIKLFALATAISKECAITLIKKISRRNVGQTKKIQRPPNSCPDMVGYILLLCLKVLLLHTLRNGKKILDFQQQIFMCLLFYGHDTRPVTPIKKFLPFHYKPGFSARHFVQNPMSPLPVSGKMAIVSTGPFITPQNKFSPSPPRLLLVGEEKRQQSAAPHQGAPAVKNRDGKHKHLH